MPRFIAPALVTVMLAGPTPAVAVVQGAPSSLGQYTVRLIGNGNCTGVVVARRAVVTASHCARGMRVIAGGVTFRIAGVSRSAVLDDGRRLRVSGDAAILRLSSDLPFNVGAAPVGQGSGERFTIAGYGTTSEEARGAFGALHEASLVAASRGSLVDPNRSGAIGASACFGDSGGPVMRGGMLVGIVTRANYPRKRIACGYFTRWAPLSVSGSARAAATQDGGQAVSEPRRHKRHRHVRRTRHRTAHR